MSLPDSRKVLTFDIGIRNLAWCMAEKDKDNTWTIHGWENYDLHAESTTQDAKDKSVVLCACGKTASYVIKVDGTNKCVKCCPKTHPPLRDLSGVLIKKIPGLPGIRKLVETLLKNPPKKKTRKDLVAALEEKFSMPFAKTEKKKPEDITAIHNSIQKFIDKHKHLFQTATHILLENQPVFKNPTMKSVQILLFASLRERLFPSLPYVGFIHAGKKTVGSTKGDVGYSSRKKASEERVQEFFSKKTIREKSEWTQFLQTNQKKSDLCDTLCMCLDYLG